METNEIFELDGKKVPDDVIYYKNCKGEMCPLFFEKDGCTTYGFTKCNTQYSPMPEKISYKIINEKFVKIE